MTTQGGHPLLGKWRLVAMELWDAEYIDMLGPGHIQFDRVGGHFSFGVVQADIDCHYGPASVHFTWFGYDEMTEVSGDGDAELEEDGTRTGEIRFHLGDETEFTAKPW